MLRPEAYQIDPVQNAGFPFETTGIAITIATSGKMFMIAPFKNAEVELNRFLQENCGVTLPGSAGASASEQFQLLWCRAGAYFLVCPPEVELEHLGELGKHSAINEVTDGWPCLLASGNRVEACLQYKIAMDLAQVPEETTFITLLDELVVHFYKTKTGYYLRTERSLFESMSSKLQEMVERFDAAEKFSSA